MRNEKLGCTNQIQHRKITADKNIITEKPYRYPREAAGYLFTQIKNQYDSGIIADFKLLYNSPRYIHSINKLWGGCLSKTEHHWYLQSTGLGPPFLCAWPGKWVSPNWNTPCQPGQHSFFNAPWSPWISKDIQENEKCTRKISSSHEHRSKGDARIWSFYVPSWQNNPLWNSWETWLESSSTVRKT